jgi:hypothetical protein
VGVGTFLPTPTPPKIPPDSDSDSENRLQLHSPAWNQTDVLRGQLIQIFVRVLSPPSNCSMTLSFKLQLLSQNEGGILICNNIKFIQERIRHGGRQ